MLQHTGSEVSVHCASCHQSFEVELRLLLGVWTPLLLVQVLCVRCVFEYLQIFFRQGLASTQESPTPAAILCCTCLICAALDGGQSLWLTNMH